MHENQSLSVIYVNYLLICLIGLFGVFILLYSLNLSPELSIQTVSFVIVPVFLDWIFGIVILLSLRILEPLSLIDPKRRFSLENIFAITFLVSFLMTLLYALYNTMIPRFIVIEAYIIYIIPLLYMKNLWFLLQYKEKLLKKNFSIGIYIFLILMVVLSIVDLFTQVQATNLLMGELFDLLFYSSSALYFILSAYLALHFLLRNKWEDLSSEENN